MATKLNEIYKCEKCGNIVEMVHASAGTLVCCGEEMKLYTENTKDAAKEKHVPVIEKIDGGYKVTVGAVEHPMTPEHFIEFIELITDTTVLRAILKPGEKPVAQFKTEASKITAREYCNLHGLWSATN
ncbi:MAG: desulfoferrodoxin [Spirochaetes bacterium GWF1_31_7]|nr:MAG: desulfoferrodoxin [Spirochaetes bacterium GWE1_32_154]OHD46937.1 MAG: desulfoferrodoxin [Spirochaetes bacterium GWF1_31_7]OHD48715.1 MAG: desulfoferrodoxin [Spirochaetes bacterium GWE2_31_10]OHD82596.1 MAG: desulfoferrodoxin [Spirochaetes bacterium RIFOXYB1_FULL_32_8]HBD95556.1 desulfoferrodoxin [Spirochaetia bacterium]